MLNKFYIKVQNGTTTIFEVVVSRVFKTDIVLDDVMTMINVMKSYFVYYRDGRNASKLKIRTHKTKQGVELFITGVITESLNNDKEPLDVILLRKGFTETYTRFKNMLSKLLIKEVLHG